MPLGPISSIEGILGQELGLALGIGIGVPLSTALTPEATAIRQTFYSADPNLAVDPYTAARIVAQGLATLGWGEGESVQAGVNNGRFDLIQQSELRAPAIGELLQLVRRSAISDDLLTHALRKAQLEPQYDSLLKGLAVQPLAPGEIATAIHRGIMTGTGLIVTEPPTDPGKVPIVPPSTLDPVTQAAWWGLDHEKLRVLVGISGLPLSLGEMLQLLNRGEVTEDDVRRSVAESNVRNEYMDVALNLRRRLLTPNEYAELQLRGFLTQKQRDDGAALSGMTGADAELLYNVLGRAPAVHTITKGLAFGGVYNGGHDGIPEVYLSALQRGNLRPEYYDIAYHDRYLWPSAFVLRALVQAGEVPADEAEKVLLYNGWEPTFAKLVSTSWAGAAPSTADKHIGKAETQVWTKLHTSYVDNLSTDAETQADLATIGVAQAAIPQVLKLWQVEREITRRSLTPAQLKKAAAEKLMTAEEATARLLALGYSAEDAGVLLSE